MPTVCSICHHECSEPEPTQPESLLMGAASKSKEIWQHGGVVYIQYPVSDLTSPSWCFCEFSLSPFICFPLFLCWLCRPSLHPACFSQSCTQMFSSVFNFTVSHINPNKHTNLCFLPHSLPPTGCCDDAG